MIERYLNLFSVAFLAVVLVVFVVLFAGTPLCSLGTVHANVPWAGSATLLAGSERDLDIHVTRDRQFVIGHMFVPQRDLRRQLAAIAHRTGDRHVLVHADGSVPFALVQDVLAASRDAGYTEVSLVTFRGTRIDAWEKGGAV
jgi:biopolymer transport protein ExbD